MILQRKQRAKAITLSDQRYAETFQAFVSRSNEYEAMLRSLSRTSKKLNKANFSCLDVGAGTGTLIRDWSKLQHSPSYYSAIEPNADFLPHLKETVNDMGLPGNIFGEPFHPSFRLPEHCKEHRRFDVILFSHSLYYLSDPAACVSHAIKELLADDGAVLIFHIGPFGLYNLFRKYDRLLERDRPILGPSHGLSSDDISRELCEKVGLHVETDVDFASIDLTNVFEKGSEKERDEVISFMLQAEFAELDASLKEEILQALSDMCEVGHDGRLHMYHPAVSIRASPGVRKWRMLR